MNKAIRAAFIALAIVKSTALYSQDKSFIPPMPENLELVDFYLHTVDLGELVHEKYGHTQIRVHDRLSGSDIAYTWGMFDYQDPEFALKFYRGIMKYKIGAYQTAVAHRIYKYDGRQVWEDKLEINTDQKRRLMEKIIFQMQPENREYDYQYFFDNCSTRPRDFIDAALDGLFMRRYENEISDFSFRDMVRTHQATTPLSGLGLEVTMNGRLDRKMTQWEEMFLPKSLRRFLMNIPQFDKDGSPIPNTSVLTPVRTYYESPTPQANYRIDDLIAYAFLGLFPFIAFATLAWNRKNGHSPFSKPLPKYLVRLFGLSLVFWGLLAFVFGTVMSVSWAFSNHLDLHHNANLWLFWPIDLLFVFAAFPLLRYGSPPVNSLKIVTATRFLIILHIIAAALCGILTITGVIHQDLSRVFAVFGICGLVIYLTLLRLTAKRTRTSPVEQSL